jgi:hypothetical protein
MCICGRSSCDASVPKPNNQNSSTSIQSPPCYIRQPPSGFPRPMSCSHPWVIYTSIVVLRRLFSYSYLLGLLAKIKCSICSYQLNLWYGFHLEPFKINLIFVPCGGSLDLFSPPASGLDIAHTRRVLLVLRYHPNQLIVKKQVRTCVSCFVCIEVDKPMQNLLTT